jgi:CheY-like chemotaxis protein
VLLIIDDDLDDLDLYAELLQEINHDPYTTFTDARKALDHLQSSDHLPDLILLDVNMPLMNGLEFLEVLRGEPRLMDIRAVLVSTSCNHIIETAAKELGSDCHQKPPTFNEFKSLLSDILNNTHPNLVA